MEGLTTHSKIAFVIVNGDIMTENSDRNTKIAWYELEAKYASQTVPKYIKLK